MDSLPQEALCTLFSNITKQSYQSLACVSPVHAEVARQTKTMLMRDSQLTDFYGTYHMTKYQSAMLSHLLTCGEYAVFKSIPDYFNMCVIAALYSLELSKTRKVCLVFTEDSLAAFLVNISRIPCVETEMFAKMKEGTNFAIMLDISEITSAHFAIGVDLNSDSIIMGRCIYSRDVDINLTLSHDIWDVHPSYADEQMYKVWINTSPGKISLPRNRVAELGKDLKYPFSVTDLANYDVFVVKQQDPVIVYDLYSTLSQHFCRPKMIVCNSVHQGTTCSGHLPLPLAMFYEVPSSIPLQKTRLNCRSYCVSYAEMIIVGRYGETNNCNPDITAQRRVLDSWLIKTCGRVSLKVSNPKRITGRVVAKSDRFVHERVPIAGRLTVRFMDDVDLTQKWVLIDPTQNIGEVPISCDNIVRFALSEGITRDCMLAKLERSRRKRGKDAFTVEDLRALATEIGVTLSRRDNKNAMIDKISESLLSH